MNPSNLDALLDRAEGAARAAGALLGAIAGGPLEVIAQTRHDTKLQADRDAEALILEALAPSGVPVLAEESGAHGDIASQPYWVVDPLDGTVNFSRGLPVATVSIALVQGETPLLGVVYDVFRGECFAGIAAPGRERATRDGAPMRAAGTSERAKAVLTTAMPLHFEYGPVQLRAYLDELRRFKKVRQFGSAAFSLAYVACGRVDAYLADDVMYWDLAAGIALVRAAGGHVALEANGRTAWSRRIRAAASPAIFAA